MKTQTVLLSQVKVNAANPRTITERKLRLLVERLLAFPKMITLRPVVVDEKMTALGGNMRLRAFSQISHMTLDDIAQTLAKTKNFQRLIKVEQKALLAQWQAWLEQPTVEIAKASDLTEAEKQEFIIADNASFGEWDYDKLANEWDNEDLANWGVDVWQPEPPMPAGGKAGGNNADDLPKIEGKDETLMERVILVYPKERAEEVAQMLGLPKIDKVVYNITEIIPSEEEPGE